MKKVFYLTPLTFLIFISSMYAQIYDGDLTLSSQAEVDAFNYTEVGGDLIIRGNDITDLSKLSSLESAWNVIIDGNLQLKNLQGLNNFGYIDYLIISNNAVLENLDGLDVYESTYGFIIHDNPKLVNIDALKGTGIDDETPNLSIYNNPSLSVCCSVVRFMGGRDVYVYNNAPGCNSTNEIKVECERLKCDDDIIELRSQAEVDNFNCSHLKGTLRIYGNNITHLDSLYKLQTIGGNLSIYNNDNLKSLHGLENLSSVGGDLEIFNRTLESLDGLENLTSVGGKLNLVNNDKLTNLEGLNALLSVGSLTIWENDNLLNLKGLDQLHTVNGEIYILRNQSLKNLEGLSSLGPEHNSSITFHENPSLTELTGLENLEVVHGDLIIHENPSLSNISGLENLEIIHGDLFIYKNPSLSDISALENLETIHKRLIISFNPSLINLNGLENLTHIGASLSLHDNSSLSGCCVISKLLTVADQSVIRDNAAGCNSTYEVNGCDEPDQENAVVSFTLVNAKTEQDIMELTDGMKIYLHDLPNVPLNIRANTQPATVDYVYFSLTGPLRQSKIDNAFPYALYWDEDGNYHGKRFGVGTYYLSAYPLSKPNMNGEKGIRLDISFEIVEEVNNCAGFTASLTNVLDVSTCGGNDGSATVSVSGSVGEVTYTWSHGAITATATGLAEGEYTVIVSDAQGCSTTLSVTIESPSLPEVTLSPFATISETDAAFVLSEGAPAGGTYSGAGVSNGMFDPSAVGTGSYEITYTYTDPATHCTNAATQWITVGNEDEAITFMLVNTATQQDVFSLNDQSVIDLSVVGMEIGIRAEISVSGTVKKVRFELTGDDYEHILVEGEELPFSVFGDLGDTMHPWPAHDLKEGEYTLKAKSTIKINGVKEILAKTIDFTVVHNQAASARTLNTHQAAWDKDLEEEILEQSPQKLEVYPNPFTNVIQVAISDFTGEMVEVHLIDLYGKTIFHEVIETTPGQPYIHVDTGNLPNGTYILKVEGIDRVEMIKLIKQH